jgi:hypothetical protein
MNLNNYEVGNITKPSYATLKFLPFVICVYSVASLGFNSSNVVAQVDAGQQIDYARYKTPINGLVGKEIQLFCCMAGQKLGMNGATLSLN